MDSKFAYFFLRLPLAMSMFGHGLVRLPKLSTFAQGMVEQFQDSVLPEPMVIAFGYILPVLELVVGLLLMLGLFTRFSIFLGLFTMALLVFGSSMIENWGAISSQLVHSVYYGILLWLIQYNRFSVDDVLQKNNNSINS